MLFDAASARKKKLAARKSKTVDPSDRHSKRNSHLLGPNGLPKTFNPGALETAMNPVFISQAMSKLKGDIGGAEEHAGWRSGLPDSFAGTVAAMQSNDLPPPVDLWEPLRERVTAMYLQLQEAQAQLSTGGDGGDVRGSRKMAFTPVTASMQPSRLSAGSSRSNGSGR